MVNRKRGNRLVLSKIKSSHQRQQQEQANYSEERARREGGRFLETFFEEPGLI